MTRIFIVRARAWRGMGSKEAPFLDQEAEVTVPDVGRWSSTTAIQAMDQGMREHYPKYATAGGGSVLSAREVG